MEPAEPLIHWPEPFMELLGFVASFLAAGAVGFRLFVVRRMIGAHRGQADETLALNGAIGRAAAFGLAGAAVSLLLLAQQLPEQAARGHHTVAELLTTNFPLGLRVLLMFLAVLGFTLALARVGAGWALAALGVLVAPLTGALTAQWVRLVNPVHQLAGGLWIGTLFVMLAAGLAHVLRARIPSERRGLMASEMVHAFSPLALTSAGLLATMGVITAWRHLKRLNSLWTTPYGITLDIKLFVVLCVLALGAWNWRRQKPLLGTEAAALDLRRSARAELLVAGLVLVVTAVLVSLPGPK